MKASLLIMFFSIIYLSKSSYVYKPQQVIDFFSTFTYDTAKLQLIIDSLAKTFNDSYAFNEIVKNPPNTPYAKNYFKKIDFENELKKVDKSNVYLFFQGVKKALNAFEDLHINFHLETFVPIFTLFNFFHPLRLYIKMHNNKPRIFGEAFYPQDIWRYFKNYQTVFETINANKDEPIASINGQNPFDFITNIGKDYFYLKSPQATFVYKYFYLSNNINYYLLPLSLEDLTEFNVEYDNGQNFTSDYIFISEYKINNMNANLENILASNELKGENIIKKSSPSFPNNILFKNENKLIKESIINKGNESLNDEKIKWDYNHSTIYKCRVDETNQINVNYISSFGTQEELQDYFYIVEKCFQLFDNNTYPIIVISSLNGGGQAFLSQKLLDLLSPKVNFNIYGAYRKTKSFKNSKEFNSILSANYFNPQNCKPLTFDDLVKKEHKIDYGNDISDTLTETFVLNGKEYKDTINSFKKNLKNPRRPTDIIVFTDGFSYSSADVFLKYFQYYGGGLTVGYLSNPQLENKFFDSGLSPSITLSSYLLNLLSPEGFKPMYNTLGIGLDIPGVQTFYSPDNMSIPLEYEVAPVDDVVDIYEKFDDSNYDKFIQEAKKLFEKYNTTRCIKNNKKIVLVTSECDGKFGNKYTHGGYECGDDGKWTSNCVASYCDVGYIFDYNKNKCVVDVCSTVEKENNKLLYYLLFGGAGLILLIIIFIIICIICRKRREKQTDMNTIENIKLVENMEISDK